MKRLLALAALLLVPSTAHADGCPPSQCATATVAVPGAPTLAVRPAGSSGPAAVYDLRSGTRAFTLPSGVLSADGRRHFATQVWPRETTIDTFDARTARRLAAWSLPGRWWLNAVSGDGGHVAFTEIGNRKRNGTMTTRLLVTTQHGRVVRDVHLKGIFEVEAVSRHAQKLFLVQYLPRGYVVRAYDFGARRLSTIRAGADPAVMNGIAWGSVPSADGRWLLTLYIEPAGETAIHALDVRRGIAACIDLPGSTFEEGRHYTLLVGPGGRAALAANAATGTVARVDLDRLRVESVSRFTPETQHRPYGGTGAFGDGEAWFAAERSVWSYDLRTGDVAGPRRVARRVVGVGVSPAGAVRVVALGGRVTTLQ